MINGRYKILNQIGEGRSKVFLCQDSDNNYQRMAIKILPSNVDKKEIITFKEEFLILKKLDHPNIVRVYDYGTVVEVEKDGNQNGIEEGSKYFTLDFIQGVKLDDYYKEDAEELLKDIISQICYTLYYLHSSNYIYYDLKFENILVQPKNSKPLVKLIDFGLTRNAKDISEVAKMGTAEYIAPEILSDKKIDFKIDFYSLGVLLYKMIYKKFPATGNSELEIFKEHLEKEFQYDSANYSEKLVNVIKKLLDKDPDKRFKDALQIITGLGIRIDDRYLTNWNPARTFIMNNIVMAIREYLVNKESDGIISITGEEGAGKTLSVEEIYYNNEDVILINSNSLNGHSHFWKKILKEILYTDFVYRRLSSKIRSNFNLLLLEEPPNLIEEIRSIFIQVSSGLRFTIIFDDIFEYDPFTIRLLEEVIPIFLANNIKVIITQNDTVHNSTLDTNKSNIKIALTREDEVIKLLERTFSANFPLDEIKNTIIEFSDLHPGRIYNFIKDLFYIQVLQPKPGYINFSTDSKKIQVLKRGIDQIFELRLSGLSSQSKEIAETLSLLQIPISETDIQLLLKSDVNQLFVWINELKEKNIIKHTAGTDLIFTSSSLHDYIYQKVEDKELKLFTLAWILKADLKDFNRNEIARMFESAGKYVFAYEVLCEEIKSAESLSAFSYQRNLLQQLLEYKLDEKRLFDIKLRLSRVNFKLKDYRACLKETDELLGTRFSSEDKAELLIQKAGSLLGTGSYVEGKGLYETILPVIKDEPTRLKVLVEIANAEFHLTNFEECKKKCLEVIEAKYAAPGTIARSYNLLGVLEFSSKNDVDKAMPFFTEALRIYRDENLGFEEARTETNVGNIYSLKGNFSKAEYHWQRSLNKNLTTGSLDQEAAILLNYGIYYFDRFEFEKAVNNYKRAFSIYNGLGNKNEQGLVQTNMGEIFLNGGEYKNASEALAKAKNIFESLENKNEVGEVLFLQGRLYFELNDIEHVDEIIQEYELVIVNNSLPEKHNVNLTFIKQLRMLCSETGLDLSSELIKVRDYYLKMSEYTLYITVNILLTEIFIANSMHERAIDTLNQIPFLENIENRPLFHAWKNYLLGRISYEYKDSGLKPSLDYFEMAYDEIKEKSITELSWKILFALAETYLDRGNLRKANEFIILSKSLINHFAFNIGDIRIRRLYLSKPARKSAMEKLNVWEKFVK